MMKCFNKSCDPVVISEENLDEGSDPDAI